MVEHAAAPGWTSGSGRSRDMLESAARRGEGNLLNKATRLCKIFTQKYLY